MINYVTYVTICWGLFYLLYTVWLRKETFFSTNRWYLLITLLAGLLIPLIEFDFPVTTTGVETNPSGLYLETITVTAQAFETNLEEVVITAVNDSWSTRMILLAIYWLGVIVFAARFLYGIFQIGRLALRGKVSRKTNYTLIETDQVHLPFSFMNYLFWSKAIDFKEGDHEKILRHELCHIKGKHSIDVLITELLSIFLWCSPFVFLYKKALKNIHEYLADDAVLKNTPTKQYGQLLLEQSMSGLQIAQANNFIHSQLKKRIQMMTRTKSQNYAKLKYAAILPIFLLLVFSISAKTSLTNLSLDQAPAIPTDTVPASTDVDGTVYQVVQQMPMFKGCENEPADVQKSCADRKMLTHIYTNIKYPAEARKNGIQGTVIATFIIEKDGSISNVDIRRKIGGGCDEEVSRLVSSMPAFYPGMQSGKPVRVQYNLPVRFKLEGDVIKDNPSKKSITIRTETKLSPAEKPLYVLNGKVVESIEDINPDDIKEVNVIKGEAAQSKYGDEGKNGVVEVITIKPKIFVTGYGKPKSSVPPPPPPPMPDERFEEEVFVVVEQMPMFPGATDKESSNQELFKYVFANLKYPKQAKDNAVEGTSVVSFVVTKEGLIKNVLIRRSIGFGTDEEVVRVVKGMNDLSEKWTPGYQRGKAVNVQMNLPIKFKLDDEQKATQAEERNTPKATAGFEYEKLEVFPNPTSGQINISLETKEAKMTTITISDVNGKQLYRQQVNDKSINISDYDVSKAANGLLLVTFEREGKVVTKEVLLQR